MTGIRGSLNVTDLSTWQHTTVRVNLHQPITDVDLQELLHPSILICSISRQMCLQLMPFETSSLLEQCRNGVHAGRAHLHQSIPGRLHKRRMESTTNCQHCALQGSRFGCKNLHLSYHISALMLQMLKHNKSGTKLATSGLQTTCMTFCFPGAGPALECTDKMG